MSISVEMDSVLAHLVFGRGIGMKPEDATTEALAYVLNRSEAIRRRIQDLLCSLTGLHVAPIQKYETQVKETENQRPDIVGYSDTNQQVVLIENKFWADLTDNQPVGYLNVFETEDHPGILLFVCPSMRVDLLWGYLLDRVRDAKISMDEKAERVNQNDMRVLLLRERQCALCIISWNRLLEDLRQAAQDAGDWSVMGDLKQISGLVARVDAENPFLPLREENLTQSQGRLFRSLQDIDDRVRSRLVGIDPRYYMPKRNNTWVNCKEGRIKWFGVGLSVELWAQWGYSPFWIRIGSWDKNPDYSILKSCVADWLKEGPQHGVEGSDENNRPIIGVPLLPPLGVERDEVVEELSRQAIEKITYIEQRIESRMRAK